MDWTGNRSAESFRYVKADWPSLLETGLYGNITGGSVVYAALSTTKGTCQFDFDGGTPPDTVDAVRVYYGFTDSHGERWEQPIGTYLVSYSSIRRTSTAEGMRVSGTVEGISLLSVLSDRLLGYPLQIAAGTLALQKAHEICEDSFSLQVVEESATDERTAKTHTFEPSDSYLTVVNWLLSEAGCESADVDSFGRIVFRGYETREKKLGRRAAWTFGTGRDSILVPTIVEENDWQRVANVVRMCYLGDDVMVTASASLVRGAKMSLAARGGRERTLYEDVSEIQGGTSDAMKQYLMDRARKKLLDNANEIIHLEWTHAYVPIVPGDPVKVEYGGSVFEMTLTNMTVQLSPSAQTKSKGRAFITNDMEVETDARIVWTA